MTNSMPIPHYGRKKTAACSIGKFLVIHGGVDQLDTVSNTVQVFDFRSMRWSKVIVNQRTEALQLHAMAVAMSNTINTKNITDLSLPLVKAKVKLNEGLFVFGGRNDKGRATDRLWRFRMFSNPWLLEEVEDLGSGPAARFGHSMSYLSNLHCLVVYGGENEVGRIFGNLYLFSLYMGQWIDIKFTSRYKPTPRTRFASCAVEEKRNSKIYILGGLSDNNFVGGTLECVEFDSNLYSKFMADMRDNSVLAPSETKEKIMFGGNVNIDVKKRYVREKLKKFSPNSNYMPFPTQAIESKIKS